MKYIIFNPLYNLKPDEGRALVMPRFVGRNLLNGEGDSFTNIIHPIFAMILTFIDGRSIADCVNDAARSLNVPNELIENFVNQLLDKDCKIKISSSNTISLFPPRTIISLPHLNVEQRYTPEIFDYVELDMKMKRHLTPSSITLMLNNTCTTKCVYCYQDKTRLATCSIPISRIIELIKEAKALHVNSFDVIGGEFFLYPHWRKVLKELREKDFNPYISTKKPLCEEEVDFLKRVKLRDIQISIDSLISEHIQKSLGVTKNYIQAILDTLDLLDKAGISIIVHSVLTKYNMEREDMESVYKALCQFKNIVDWHIVKGEESLYPQIPYQEIEIPDEKLNGLIDYLESIDKNNHFSIHPPQRIIKATSYLSNPTENEQEKNFFKLSRSYCSGLFSALYILPDGNVTMCEQLYWNTDFIVGNIKSQSLLEIWNSPEALSIFNIRQEDIPNDSLCHTCDKFAVCRTLRQVCYREIIRKYGKDKWYYPDVNCPYSSRQENLLLKKTDEYEI